MTKKKEIHCSTCNVKITNLQGSARFTCPSCGKVEIVRCRRCREIVAKYECSNCKFSGPN